MGSQTTHDLCFPTVVDLHDRRERLPAPTVSVRVTRSGLWTIIEVDGEMDLQVVPLISELLGGAATQVVFELHGVTFMDTGGLDAMLNSRREAVRNGGCVRLVAPSRHARRLLMLTGDDRLFLTFDSLDDAMVAAVPSGPDLAS